jgi:hypothetical protein
MRNPPFPLVSAALLSELEKRFPDRMPETGETADEIRIRQGSVKVVRFPPYPVRYTEQDILRAVAAHRAPPRMLLDQSHHTQKGPTP